MKEEITSNVYLCLKDIIESSSFLSINNTWANDNGFSHSLLLDKLASYLQIEANAFFNRNMNVSCISENVKIPYIVLSPQEIIFNNHREVYILIIFDLDEEGKSCIIISLVIENQKPNSDEIIKISDFAKTHTFINGIVNSSGYLENSIIPESGIFCSKNYTKDNFPTVSDFFRYINNIKDAMNLIYQQEKRRKPQN